jgi:uncharacterized protein (TIGR03790 family)
LLRTESKAFGAASLWGGLLISVLLIGCPLGEPQAIAGGGPRNVLVVQNTMSTISGQIANHYVAARGIPPENVCRIRCSTVEVVSQSECETNIVQPIRAFLQQPAISDRIDYIVVTKGVPLAANYGYGSGPLSVSSILTCVGEPPREGHPGITEPIENPYGPTVWMYPVVEEAFSHSYPFMVYTGDDFYECHLYLVTRLDGYTLADVLNMIDRSVSASASGPILLDRKYVPPPPTGYTVLNDALTAARDVLLAKEWPVIYDDTSEFIGNQTGLMGYFSWGSNDAAYTHALYASNTFAPGSIADTFVSTSGRTFNTTSGGQSLIADLLPLGACGVNGYVSEPYVGYSTYPDVLFDRYTSGFNLAESFFAACPELYWKSVVVGDPLMTICAEKPLVSIESPATLTGVVTVSAVASDPNGIAKVDFYFDGVHLASDYTEPYTAVVDTTQFTVSQHTLEAVAQQATPVAIQGSSAITVLVENPVSNLSVVSDAFPNSDGQGVRATEKMVTAGTAEMGGSEFYIEEMDRSSGIRIMSSQPVEEGHVITVVGNLTTDSGERSLGSPSITVIGQALGPPIQPLGMPNRTLGGGDFTPNTRGVSGGCGLRNIGLLVRTWGRVTYVGGQDEGFFYIDDGSALDDGSGHIGVKVASRSLQKPELGSVVSVTGLSATEQNQDRVTRLLKPRRQSDIRPVVQ